LRSLLLLVLQGLEVRVLQQLSSSWPLCWVPGQHGLQQPSQVNSLSSAANSNSSSSNSYVSGTVNQAVRLGNTGVLDFALFQKPCQDETLPGWQAAILAGVAAKKNMSAVTLHSLYLSLSQGQPHSSSRGQLTAYGCCQPQWVTVQPAR
jgi:hypothetical protein